MPKIISFQKYADRYDKWFEENQAVYQAELKAVKSLLPEGNGIEIGTGTGRFSEPLGIKTGIEPSDCMRAFAQKRGIKVLGGAAESLPFRDSIFEFVLMVTVICFLDDLHKSFKEVYRVLSEGGYFIIGMIDRNSMLGQTYLKHKNDSLFYKDASFYSVEEVLEIMKQTGFDNFIFCQTLFSSLSETDENETLMPGYGKGAFVVIRGRKINIG